MTNSNSTGNNEQERNNASTNQHQESSPLLQQPTPHVRSDPSNNSQDSTTTSITVSQCSSQTSELTPLLHATEIPQHSFLRRIFDPNWLHVAFIVVIILIGLTVITFHNIQSVVNDAIDLQVYNATFANFTSHGVNVHVQGSVEMKYHLMHTNPVQIAMIKVGAFVLGTLKLVSLKPVQLHVQLVDLKSPFLYLADTSPPPIAIYISNRAKTELNFLTECTFGNTEFLDFLKYYYQLTGDDINLKVRMIAEEVNVNTLKLINLRLHNVEVSDHLTINKNDLKKGLKINKFGVTSPGANIINLSAQLELPNQWGISLGIPALQWDLLFNDCDSNLVKVGAWRTLPTTGEANDTITVDVDGVVEDVPDRLMEDCKDSVSPINSLIEQYLREEPIKFYLHLSEGQSVDSVPHDIRWILDTLKRMPPAELAVALPRTHIMPKNLRVNSCDLAMNYTDSERIDVSKKDGSFAGKIKSNCSIEAVNPSSLQVGVDRLKFNVSLGSKNGALVQAWSRNFVLLDTTQSKHLFHVDVNISDLDVDVMDPVYFGKVVNSMINKNSNFPINDDVYVNVSLSEVDTYLPIVGNATLRRLDIPFVKLPQVLDVLQDVSKVQYDSIVSQLNVEIEEVYYLGSSEHEVEFQVLISLYNPLNVSLEIPRVHDQAILMEFGQDKTKFGYASFKQISLTKLERSKLEVNIKFRYETYSDKLFLQDFISVYASSFTKDLTIDLTNNSVAGNDGLDAFMTQIKIHNVTMPNVTYVIPKYNIGNTDVTNTALAKQDVGDFIIETTIHVFTSELELKIYNPISNAEVRLEIFQAFAKHEDVVLGYVSRREVIDLQPGFYVTPRIPIKIENGAATDILKRALNGDLSIDVMADVNVGLELFDLRLIYKGKQLVSKIRW
ncbi:hypothetical protein CORT_0H01530 [Candida orthopsilosis Co 90-125]|uniref:Tag1-like fifth Ig-like domain-containing protein n=1 Tax=Candida orthopsilosis (strain 90-125) TaxID=1136231 RepID=H8XB18_CANO9|nr:hypothetical protein CORT_0H01530 [Candida orthopsilosis Co 90-125]CCG25266.1 hypothetical protein CORT_0H01530 [Candida orthopsilosis Co 90-125]